MNWQVLVSIFGGGSLVTLIQFLVNRWDKKKGKYNEVLKEIGNIKKELHSLHTEIEEDRATNARIRILAFSDEIRHEYPIRRSKESFDQIYQDIDKYKVYCKSHDEYENSRAVQAINHIETIYNQMLRDESFLP